MLWTDGRGFRFYAGALTFASLVTTGIYGTAHCNCRQPGGADRLKRSLLVNFSHALNR